MNLNPGSTYEVKGKENVLTGAPPASPFGAYPMMKHNACVPHPPHSAKKSIKKSILLANLSASDPNKPGSSKNNGLTHTVVTQVVVNLIPDVECNVTHAAAKVKEQVGFDVILLDIRYLKMMSLLELSFGNLLGKLLRHHVDYMKNWVALQLQVTCLVGWMIASHVQRRELQQPQATLKLI